MPDRSLSLSVVCVFACVCVSTGGKLLPGYESDSCHSADVHERGRCILGHVPAADQSETRRARCALLII